MTETVADLHRRLERELLDSYDEELEMELDDQRFEDVLSQTPEEKKAHLIKRRHYFRELLRLQGS